MNINDANKRIGKLRKLINYHRNLYHTKIAKQYEEISAEALDSLKKELFDLENKYPELITPDSPTQKIAGKALKEFSKVKHYKKMYSLNDAFNEADLKDWEKRIKRFLKKEKHWTYLCELKIDGLAVELIYKDDILVQGSTRGDGLIGEDITQNLKTINLIPSKIDSKSNTLVIYGEVFVPILEFEKINQEQNKNNLLPYSNPRNLAAGSLRQLDPEITAKRNLSFIAYDVSGDINFKTHQDKHLFLKKIGFLGQNDKKCQNLKEVFDFYKQVNQDRENLKYKIDGIVVLVNESKIFKDLGVTGKSSRASIAYKFLLKETTTKLKNIVIQIGRTGILTPVAILEPVQIDGVTISRATLHNQNEIQRLGLKIGDTIVIGRAGDVVPKIIKVLSELRDQNEKEIFIPKICPYCEHPLNKKGTEELFYCLNKKCFNRIKQNLYHFVSKKCFDIVGCGPKIIDKLLEANLINNASDLFDLEKGDVINLEGFSNLASENLIKSIKKNSNISFHKFIFALGIKGVGEQMSLSLSKKNFKIENLSSAIFEKLIKIKDVGPIVASSIINWFKNQQNKIFLKKLLDKIKIQYPEIRENSKIKDKKFLFTGVFKKKREELKEMVLSFDGKIISSVSLNLDYLIVGENPGSKLDKAKKILTIKIISENEFFNLIK